MIRVLIAEDSVTVRELLENVLAADPEIFVAGVATNGLEAVEMTRRLHPDVVTMDINMPVMNGLEATKRIMNESPTPIVIISGSVDVREVSVSMAALQAGALALLEKPPAVGAPEFEQTIRHLVSTVKAMADVKVVQHRRHRHEPPTSVLPEAGAPPVRTRIVALAASTGGPAALGQVLSSLPADFPVPILVVQHMARGFLGGFASWLSGNCILKVKLAAAGELLKPSTVYIAGDDRHLGVTSDFRVKLDDGKAICGFRPSANYMFASVAAAYGASSVAAILTGMGQDGLEGLRQLRAAGGRIIAQDEASCVVFGMPRAVIEAGLADTILPLSLIGQTLVASAAGQDRGKGETWA